MIYNITRTDRNIDRAVEQLVGKRFGLIYKFKNGSIGSKPYVISKCTSDFNINTESQAYERKCNIELRPRGIIIHFRIKSSSFIWPIAYDVLALTLLDQQLVVSDDTREAQLIPHVKTKKDSTFLQKTMKYQAAYLCQ